MVASVEHAAENFASYPLVLCAFHRGEVSGASIYPAVWGTMLAARAEGIGSHLTTALPIFAGDGVADVLDVPPGEGWELAAAVPMGYPVGQWRVASRQPPHEVTHRNTWGADSGLSTASAFWPWTDKHQGS